jgi:hypothetical protein
MSKKNLVSVIADLSALARTIPTLGPVAPAEEVIQFSLSLRKGLRKQLPGRRGGHDHAGLRARRAQSQGPRCATG